MYRSEFLALVTGVAFLAVVLLAANETFSTREPAPPDTTTFDASSDGPFGPQYDLLSCLADLERYEQASGLTLGQARNLAIDTIWSDDR